MFRLKRSVARIGLFLLCFGCCADLALTQSRQEQKGSQYQRRVKLDRELAKALRRSRMRASPIQKGEEAGDQGQFVSIEEVREALSKSFQASRQLAQAARRLTELCQRFSSQEVEAPNFRKKALERLSKLRKLSKAIRKDHVLNILAAGFDVVVVEPQPDLTRKEFQGYSEQIQWMANRLGERIDFFYQDQDFSQVRLGEIQSPSAQSLCRGIESLSDSLRRAAKKSKLLPDESSESSRQ